MPNRKKFDRSVLESNIKLLLSKKGITQENLAREIHMSGSNFNKYLKGHTSFTIDVLFEISQFFHVSIDALCSNTFADELEDLDDEKPGQNGTVYLPDEVLFNNACEGLAMVFKNAVIRNTTVHVSEKVWERTKPDNSGCFNRFSLLDDEEHDYSAIYFSNYYEIATNFLSEEYEENYYEDLRNFGNTVDNNLLLNDFLSKLLDLNRAYRNGSMTREDYLRSIDGILKRTKKVVPD